MGLNDAAGADQADIRITMGGHRHRYRVSRRDIGAQAAAGEWLTPAT
jgi:hypothetical protein